MYLTQALRRAAKLTPDEVAFISDKRSLTWAQVQDRVARFAAALHTLGLKTEDRVAMLSLNSDCYCEYYYATFWAGGNVVPMNIRWSIPEHVYSIKDSESRFLIVDDTFAEAGVEVAQQCPSIEVIIHAGTGPTPAGMLSYEELIAAAVPAPDAFRNGEDLAGIFYTGGTTGFPKGVMLPHRSFYAVIRSMRAVDDPWIGWSAEDVGLCGFPSFHIGGLWWAITTLSHGARLVVLDSFDARAALAALREERVTQTCMVAAMLSMILAEPACEQADFSALRTIVYGGSPIALPLLKQSLEVFGCDFAQIYGLTETGNTAVCLRPRDHDDPDSELLTAAGAPYPGVRVKVIDAEGRELPPRAVGEVCLHSPANMIGYWKREEATADTLREGWVHTGDAGYLDERGYVYVCDRIKDMIIYAGENLYPAEIESAVCEHPAVLECAVIGVPDERWGEVPKAIVALREGQQATVAQILRHTKERIAAFKVPKSLDFVDALPRTPSGKVKKAELRKPYWQGRARGVN